MTISKWLVSGLKAHLVASNFKTKACILNCNNIMIKLQVIGHLGKDATVNQVNSKSVINFNIAHTEKYTSNGEKKEKTIWVNCAYWTDKTAIAPYLKKGTQVYVEGQPDIRTYESNGQHGASLELRVISVQLLGSKPEGSSAPSWPVTEQNTTKYNPDKQQGKSEAQQKTVEFTEVADDLPF